jgi:biopolymer transport protein TolR
MKAERGRSVMSEINVTPFVDVMLVLLIIFMVTAPLLQQGLEIDLPQAKGKNLPPEERMNIIITKDGSISLNKTRMELIDLRAKLKDLSPSNPTVHLKADRDVPYGLVVQVISSIKEAGIEKLGIITEPSINKRTEPSVDKRVK